MNIETLFVSSNRLLQALPAHELNALKHHLQKVNLKSGETLYESGEFIDYIYFPENCVALMSTTFSNGASLESGLIGCKGVVGACSALSNNRSNRHVCVRIPGEALKMSVEDFRSDLKQHKVFRQLIRLYISSFIEQVIQTGACNATHTLTERFARLLLVLQDAVQSDNFYATHENLASMLGVHRPSVSNIAAMFKNDDLCDYERGVLIIKNRGKLKKESCECYEVIQQISNNYNSLIKNKSCSIIPKIDFQINVTKEDTNVLVKTAYV